MPRGEHAGVAERRLPGHARHRLSADRPRPPGGLGDDPLIDLVRRLGASAVEANQRRILILAGGRTWGLALAQDALEALGLAEASVWLTPHGGVASGRTLQGRAARIVLGSDIDAAVVDLHSDLDADAIGATLGAVRGGGLAVFLLPEDGSLADGGRERFAVSPFGVDDVGTRFAGRFTERLLAAPGGLTIRESGSHTERVAPPVDEAGPAERSDPECATEGQARAVASLVAMAGSFDPRPVVLTSDRGRGKSYALGLAARRALASGAVDCVAVVSSLTAARGALRDRLKGLDEGSVVVTRPGDISRIPPGALLLVDEAATVDPTRLRDLLRSSRRIALATTVHGYEGTGRGFALRFGPVLDALGAERFELSEPIRWCAGDPLERLLFDALMLDARPIADESIDSAAVGECELTRWNRDDLVRDERALGELFGLLVLAHYRTTPSDLRRLLDAPNLAVRSLSWGGHIVAAALVAAEGRFDAEEAESVSIGRLRPRGHLLPETLSAHLGQLEGATLASARVVRIAVHPAVQGRGIGSRLLEAIVDEAASTAKAFVGSSFGVSPELLRFWLRAGFVPARVGILRGAVSGVRSAIVLRATSPEGRGLVDRTSARFVEQLPDQLVDPLRDEDPAVVAELAPTPQEPIDRAEPDAVDMEELYACAFGPRVSDATVGPVRALARWAFSNPEALAFLKPRQRGLLEAKALMRKGWSEVTEELGYDHRNQAMRALRAALVPLVLACGGEEAERARARYAGLGQYSEAVTLGPITDQRRERFREIIARRQLDLEVVLENVWDPHNASAIVRSAEAFGLLRVSLLYWYEQFPALSKHVAGRIVRWVRTPRYSSAEGCLQELRAKGMRVYATGMSEDCVSYLDVDWTLPSAVVFGNEKRGVASAVMEGADAVITVPMAGFAESFNVSVAAAIILSEASRQRRAAGMLEPPWDAERQAILDRWVEREETGSPKEP